MASSSKYDVFLSFRGTDTRQKFTGHLYEALRRKRIMTFIDNALNKGDDISSSLSIAIHESKISVIIFSEGYVSSRWCLQELVKINERRKMHDQIVIPVFYHVDLSHVRSQEGAFRDGFVELEEHFKEKVEMLQMWRTALTETTNLSDWPLSDKKLEIEARVVEDIAKNILEKLENVMSPRYSKKLVGIESSIKEIEQLLNFGSKDVLSIGIWGVGGVGKTTIAYVVFDKISCQIQGVYFAKNVKEQLERGCWLIHLQKELLRNVLGDRSPNLRCPI